jgi:hypothetical protein
LGLKCAGTNRQRASRKKDPRELREELACWDLEKQVLRSRLHGPLDHDMVVPKNRKRIVISKS